MGGDILTISCVSKMNRNGGRKKKRKKIETGEGAHEDSMHEDEPGSSTFDFRLIDQEAEEQDFEI